VSPFQRVARAIVIRDVSFIALAGGTLMVAFSFYMPLAFAIGASAALLASVALLTRAHRLTERGLTHSEPWWALAPEYRPREEGEFAEARESYEHLLFRFANAAAGCAVLLFVAALLASFSMRIAPTHGILTASLD
jgi:hypothetical protein